MFFFLSGYPYMFLENLHVDLIDPEREAWDWLEEQILRKQGRR